MRRTKKALTLLEIIIVIFLITLITGAIGYNMKGALDRGRVFRTEQAKIELHDLLLVSVSEGYSPKEIKSNPEKYIQQTGLAKDPKKLLKDGWGKDFKISLTQDNDFLVESEALKDYYKKIGKVEEE